MMKKNTNKKTKHQKKIIQAENKEKIVIDIEKSIINANKVMEEEKIKNIKPIIIWMQSIINGLMLMFVLTSVLFAWAFAKPIIDNIKNGNYFNLANLILLLDVICLIILGCYTFVINKHIDKINNISDLTGIGGFLLSCFATLIALLALMLQAEW